jgi:hypothetical protein
LEDWVQVASQAKGWSHVMIVWVRWFLSLHNSNLKLKSMSPLMWTWYLRLWPNPVPINHFTKELLAYIERSQPYKSKVNEFWKHKEEEKKILEREHVKWHFNH